MNLELPATGEKAVDIPWKLIQARQQELIEAAQRFDLDKRPRMRNWGRVPDDQVIRLLSGAFGFLETLACEGYDDAAGSEVAQVRRPPEG